jgi:alpha-galactosidase
MNWKTLYFGLPAVLLISPAFIHGQAKARPAEPAAVHGGSMSVESKDDGSYVLRSTAIHGPVLQSETDVETASGVLRSSDYPKHYSDIAPFQDESGSGQRLTVTYTGLAGTADLICEFRVYTNRPWGDIRVQVRNTTPKPIEIRSIHVIKSVNGSGVQLNGPDADDRVLSDSFSEDTPQLKIMDLGDAEDRIHRGFGSQLIYNRNSGLSLFLGALSADRLLTVFHLQSSAKPNARVLSFDAEDTGTHEALHQEQWATSYGSANVVPLRLHVAPGEVISSERLAFSIGSDCHAQLEDYGKAIRVLRHARVRAPTLMGWWSWTAYYYGVSEGTTLTNAEWLAQNLKPLGYRYFQVDEGYQFARGEYATADANAYPHGMAFVGGQVRGLGLTFGLWVAPFEVSERSWVYEHHKDWLVHNLQGDPIHIGRIGTFEELYVLDTTNPGAQAYLTQTYTTLVNEWGVRFLKLDFMDAAAVEGVFYRPNTTALEAQRNGLEVIRKAVGDNVLLDKDGSPMLTPVGIVDAGRISQDTGHTFGSTRDAATGVAARYYMNHNFFESDPDAFTVSEQIVPDRGWHGNKTPLPLNEAESSIALSAVSGGMFEIGDDLPELGKSPERLALVRNRDLLDIARLGRTSVPVDLMSYRPEDLQPSIFLLREDDRQTILTIFNWSEKPTTHDLTLAELGLRATAYDATDILRSIAVPIGSGRLELRLPAHSVRMIKFIDKGLVAAAPAFDWHGPSHAQGGEAVVFHAEGTDASRPALEFHWDFGDGVNAEGPEVHHAFTQPGTYTVVVTATGLNGRAERRQSQISVTGLVPTIYDPALKQRFDPAPR